MLALARSSGPDLDRSFADWLAERGFDSAMGARPLARTIQEHVKKPMAEELLFGKLAKGGMVSVGVEDGKLCFAYVEAPPKIKKKKKEPGEGGGGEEVPELVQ